VAARQPDVIVAAAPAALTGLRQLQGQAAAWLKKELQESRRLEAVADRRASQLAAAWEALHRQAALGDAEPLAQRYDALAAEHAAAPGRPRALKEFVESAETLTQEVRAATGRLQDGLSDASERLKNYPALAATAAEAASDWLCLTPDVAAIAEHSQAIGRHWQGLDQCARLADLEHSLAEIARLDEAAGAVYATLLRRVQQLAEAEASIGEYRQAIIENAADLDEARVARLSRLSVKARERAHKARAFDEALQALHESREFLRELAV
jgi:hypothetical protein